MPRSCRLFADVVARRELDLVRRLQPCAGGKGPPNPPRPALIEALVHRREPVGGPFDLIDHIQGRRRSQYGFFVASSLSSISATTHCPDVCPPRLQAISLALDQLGVAADPVQPLFITVDPERDTPSVLADYVSSFHARLRRPDGTAAAIQKVALAYRVFFASPPWPGPMAMRSITRLIYLVGQGRALYRLPSAGSGARRIVEALRLISIAERHRRSIVRIALPR